MRLQKWFRDNALALLSQMAIAGLVFWAALSTLLWIGERSARESLEAQIRRGVLPASSRGLYIPAQYGSSSSSYDYHFTSDLKTGLEPVSSSLRDIAKRLEDINGTLKDIRGAMK